MNFSEKNKGILMFVSSILIMLVVHVIIQILKHLIKRKFRNFYKNYMLPLFGLPRVSCFFLKALFFTSMMLTCNLELHNETFYLFFFTMNLMAFWFSLLIIYPILSKKYKKKQSILSNFTSIFDAEMAYFLGLLISFKT